jgi:hypothetical protein
MTHVGSWSFDPVTKEVKARMVLRIMRLGPEETTQEAFPRGPPEDLEIVVEHLRLASTMARAETEHRLQFDDSTRNGPYDRQPSVNSAGKVVRLYGTTQDITERKRARSSCATRPTNCRRFSIPSATALPCTTMTAWFSTTIS